MASIPKKMGNWTPKEDEALTMAFVKASENSAIGTSQSKEGFWATIQQTYLDFYKGNTLPKIRSEDSCNCRWKNYIFPKMNKWHQCVKRAERRTISGANQSDQNRQIEGYYRADMGTSFKFGNCYDVCKDWVTFDDPPQEEYGPTPVQRNSPYSLEDDVDASEASPTPNSTPNPTPTPVSRPMGRNATRRLKEKASVTGAKVIGEEMVGLVRQVVENNIRADEERARREKKREAQEELNRDEAYLMMQTTNFTPISKAYFDGRKREIVEKHRVRELFPNDGSSSNDYYPQMPDNQDE